MPPSELIPGVESRFGVYDLDVQARKTVKRIWPTIAPHLERAVDAILHTMNTSIISDIVEQHRDLIKKLELAHMEALLNGELDNSYFESCRKTVKREAALGIDARFRSTCGNGVLRVGLDALARKLAEQAKLLSKVIAFDVANAMTLHREAEETATQFRRKEIDDAIAEFGGAIGDVLEAIKDASTSLTTTCSTMREVADDTLKRMAVASSAAAETTESVVVDQSHRSRGDPRHGDG
jgi:hypothetical protein